MFRTAACQRSFIAARSSPTLRIRARLRAEIRRERLAGSWRWSIFTFHHYHSTSHEVLGVAVGHATLRLGGRKGRDFDVAAGDVIALPAGTGHKRIASSLGFLVVGAYPEGRERDLIKPYADERHRP